MKITLDRYFTRKTHFGQMVTLCHQSEMLVRKPSRSTSKTKGSCATLHFSSPKLKILGLSNAILYKKGGNNENAYQKICIFVFQKRNVCILPCKWFVSFAMLLLTLQPLLNALFLGFLKTSGAVIEMAFYLNIQIWLLQNKLTSK